VDPPLLQIGDRMDSKVQPKSTRTDVSQLCLIGAGILVPMGIIVIGGGVFLVLAVILAGVGVLVSPKGKRYLPIFMLMFTISILAWMSPEVRQHLASYRRKGYDSDVKSNLKNAATAQETYFENNGTYTNKIGSLRGFNQSDNVTIAVEAPATKFVITGTMTEGCSPNTGTWTLSSADGSISGTPCR